MKTIIVYILGLLLLGCASTESEVEHSIDHFPNTLNEPRVLHRNKQGAKQAVVSVALATTIGFMTKDNFRCSKECEEELKKSIANRAKNK